MEGNGWMHAEERHRTILRQVRENGSMRVTDIAAELGVSPVTVRKDVEVLAERGLVTRVHGGAMLPEGIAETMPVTAPGAGEGPGSGLPLRLGLVVPSANYYYPEVVRGARDVAAAAGARLVLRVSDYDPGVELAAAEQLVGDGVHGLLIAPSGSGGPQVGRHWCEDLGVPVVLVERRPGEDAPAVEHVATDHVHGARLAVAHLVRAGRRRIALLMRGSTPTSPWIKQGFLDGLRSAGLPAADAGSFFDLGAGAPGTSGYDRATSDFLDGAASGRIDAVIVHPEHDALALLQRLRERGLSVPGQIAVVSYDDEVAALADVPLTAVAPCKHEVGRSAMELLLLRLADPERPRRRMFVLPELHIRASSEA